jgi:hypothetical protein
MDAKQNQLKAMQAFFKILLVAMFLFALSALLLVGIGVSRSGNPSFHKALLVAGLILAVLLVGFSYPLFNRKLEAVKAGPELTPRLEGWREACIFQMALSVGPTLFSIIGYLLTADWIFLLLIGLLILNFLNLFPTKKKLVQQLDLSSQEADLFE